MCGMTNKNDINNNKSAAKKTMLMVITVMLSRPIIL